MIQIKKRRDAAKSFDAEDRAEKQYKDQKLSMQSRQICQCHLLSLL